MQMVEQFWFGGKAPEGWQDAWGGSARAEAEGDMPLAVDVQEEEHSFVFTADVPGVSRSDIKVRASATNQNALQTVHLILTLSTQSLHLSLSGHVWTCCILIAF